MTSAFRCVLFLIGLIPNLAFAFDAGDVVVAIRDLDIAFNNNERDQIGTGQVLRVLSIKGDRIWVSRGRPGWVDAKDLIAIDQAEAHFDKPFATGAGSRDYLARGNVRMALGKHEEGVADLKRAVQLANDPDEYLEPLGYAQLAAMDQPGAIETFNRAVTNEPASASALMGRGLAFYQVGQNQNALVDLSKAIELEPEHAFPRKYLGALLHDLGQLDAAKQQLEAAVKLDSFDVMVRRSLGRLYYDLGRYEKALNEFKIAVNLDAKDTEAITGRGVVRHAIGSDLEAAETDFAKAIEMVDESIDHAYLWSNLGQVQMELGKFADSFGNLNKAIQLDPSFNEALSNRVYLLVTHFADTAKIDSVKSDMRTVFSSDGPRTYWDYRALAAVNAVIGDLERAAKYQAIGENLLRKTGPKRFLQTAIASRQQYESQLAGR